MLSATIQRKVKEERKNDHPWRTNWRDLIQGGSDLYDMLSNMMVSRCNMPMEITRLTVSYLPLFTIEYCVSTGDLIPVGRYTVKDDHLQKLVCADDNWGFSYSTRYTNEPEIIPLQLNAEIQCPATGFIGSTQTGRISTDVMLHPHLNGSPISRERTSCTSWTARLHTKKNEQKDEAIVLFNVEVVTKPQRHQRTSRNVKFVSFLFPIAVQDFVFEHGI